MYLITRKQLIKNVPKRWDEQYPPNTAGTDKVVIGKQLKKLNLETATIHDIKNVIGNYSWTSMKCDECGRDDDDLDAVIQVSEEPDYESNTASLCKKCVKKAKDLFR